MNVEFGQPLRQTGFNGGRLAQPHRLVALRQLAMLMNCFEKAVALIPKTIGQVGAPPVAQYGEQPFVIILRKQCPQPVLYGVAREANS